MAKAQRAQVYSVINDERSYQDSSKCGGKDRTDGRQKSVGDYLTLIRVYSAKADTAYAGNAGSDLALHEIRKLAALCVAAMEDHGAPVRVAKTAPGSVWSYWQDLSKPAESSPPPKTLSEMVMQYFENQSPIKITDPVFEGYCVPALGQRVCVQRMGATPKLGVVESFSVGRENCCVNVVFDSEGNIKHSATVDLSSVDAIGPRPKFVLIPKP